MYSQIVDFSEKARNFKEVIQNESQTRTVLIEPVLKILGYDTTNPFEVVSEYTCDVGTKKGEKVDYALMQKNEVVMLIEAKDCKSKLNSKNISQLFRYFSVSTSKVGLLTNGIDYLFFTDTIKQNVMDTEPFYQFNILDVSERDIEVLKMFKKGDINVEEIRKYASTSKFKQLFIEYFEMQMKTPTNDFISFITKRIGFTSINSKDRASLITSSLELMLKGEIEKSEIVESKKEVVEKKEEKVRIKRKENENKIVGTVTLDELTLENTLRTRPTSIKIEDEIIDVTGWSDSLRKMFHYLIGKGYNADDLYLIDLTKNETKRWVSRDNSAMIRPELLPNGLFIDAHGSAWLTIQKLMRVVEQMDLDTNKILIEL